MGGAFDTFYSAGGDKPSEFFGFTEGKNYQPNGTRIAFRSDTREQVDQVAKLVRDAGGRVLEGPEVYIDYSGVLRVLFRGSGWQQSGGLLPRKYDRC